MKNLEPYKMIEKLVEERDLAIKQLNSIGVGLGDNMDHVKKALEQKWVPCSERLPESPLLGEDTYLVQQKNITQPFSAYWDGERWSDIYDRGICNIIAWRHLPEPYKDGE